VQPLAPFGFGEIKPVRRQRLIRRAGTGLIERLLARLVIVGDLRQALMGGFFPQRLQKYRCRGALPRPGGERVGVRGFGPIGDSPGNSEPPHHSRRFASAFFT
jgi:hypothetical protein